MVRAIGVLLAGGTGTRLYPASRPDRPKQFLRFGGDRSLLERTADRLEFLDGLYAVSPPRYHDRVAAAVPQAEVITDPGRDTGPAILAAVHEIASREADVAPHDAAGPVVSCFPTDHRVGDAGFEPALRRAIDVAASTDDVVCLGLKPDTAATGYGYIQPDAPITPVTTDSSEPSSVASIAAFHEKPDPATATELVDDGWYWNAGMFVWTPRAFLREAARSPLATGVDALAGGAEPADLGSLPAISVDHAVLERTDRARVVAAGFEWDDLGTWDAIGRDIAGQHDTSNAVLGRALSIDAADNVIASEDHHVSVSGVEGLVVAAYDDRVLVVPRSESERVREVVAALEDRGEW